MTDATPTVEEVAALRQAADDQWSRLKGHVRVHPNVKSMIGDGRNAFRNWANEPPPAPPDPGKHRSLRRSSRPGFDVLGIERSDPRVAAFVSAQGAWQEAAAARTAADREVEDARKRAEAEVAATAMAKRRALVDLRRGKVPRVKIDWGHDQ